MRLAPLAPRPRRRRTALTDGASPGPSRKVSRQPRVPSAACDSARGFLPQGFLWPVRGGVSQAPPEAALAWGPGAVTQ